MVIILSLAPGVKLNSADRVFILVVGILSGLRTSSLSPYTKLPLAFPLRAILHIEIGILTFQSIDNHLLSCHILLCAVFL